MTASVRLSVAFKLTPLDAVLLATYAARLKDGFIYKPF